MGITATVYNEQLRRYGLGHALWDPAPPSGQEIQLGDVGMIDEYGSFVRFFNITADADDKLNICGVPNEFKPIPLNKRFWGTRSRYLSPGPLTSMGISSNPPRVRDATTTVDTSV